MSRVRTGALEVGHAMSPRRSRGSASFSSRARFVYVWAPLPRWIPWRDAIACASGALMLVSAVALAWRKTLVQASAVLALILLSWLLLVRVPRIIGTPSKEMLWSGSGPIATLVAGGWLLFTRAAAPTRGAGRWLRGERG